MNYSKVVTDFQHYLYQLGYGKSTVQMLPRCVNSFLNHQKPKMLTHLEEENILDFYDWLHIRQHYYKAEVLSEQYIYHHIYALKTFFHWLEETEKIKLNPMSSLRFSRPERKTRRPLEKEEILHLFDACESQQEQVVLHLLYSCGLRRSEAISLNVKDVHFHEQILYVRNGKGAKRRAIPLTQKVKESLRSYYLGERNCSPKLKEPNAFVVNSFGERAGGSIYDKTLKILKKRAETRGGLSPHVLRHSIATHLLENGVSIEYVRDFLGHKHLETTEVYTQVNDKQIESLCPP